MNNLKVQIKVSNLMYEENWEIDQNEIQSIALSIDWLKENLEFKSEIDGFKITEKNFDKIVFDESGQCEIITTEDIDRCIYLQMV